MARVSGRGEKNPDLVALGEAIKQRRGKEISQEALADAAQIDRSHMGKIERGERNVTLLNVLRIAAALRCRAAELLGEAGL